MTDYKCISCGSIKESEENCSCPVCGYKMFAMPYDRKEQLLTEIQSFISYLKKETVLREELIFEGKDNDDSRFPNYDKILRYVSSKDRTEDFLASLLETVEQLRLHYATQFSNTYRVSFSSIDEEIEKHDNVLLAMAEILIPELKIELKPVEWPVFSVLYAEIPDKYLWSSASELLGMIEKLAREIARFIKLNNLYGNGHKYYPAKKGEDNKKGTDYKDRLEDAILDTEKILCKKYVVDIEDDGFDELKEMLTCLWNGIELIMYTPLFIKTYEYISEAGKISEEEFLLDISTRLKARYDNYNKAVNVRLLLNNLNDDQLFEIYKELISIDDYGILAPAGATLINLGASEKQLDELIGLNGIKDTIRKIKAYAIKNKNSEKLNIHMCFMGNPGCGKTEVARCIAGIFYENKILPTNKVVEVDRSGLVSQYFGATAEKTRHAVASAMGGVLFVDEAYALGNNNEAGGITDYGREAIDTLVKAMEDSRGKFCVIFAGYRNEMQRMLSVNPGLKSRIQFTLDFPNYSRGELRDIMILMLRKRNYTISEVALSRVLDITDIRRKDPNFANAREVRNILDQVIMCQNLRCSGPNDNEIGLIDVNKYIQDTKLNLPTSSTASIKRVLSGEEELEQLIGLSTMKRMVKKIKAYAKRNQGHAGFNLHMCFYGNPGTGKTEVARILSRILYDAGALDEAKLVETDAHGLMGRVAGTAVSKVENKINEAMGGVLFIDEAYALVGSNTVNGGSISYGEEIIATLMKRMEDNRGQFCTILAGYKNEMVEMLSANPGFKSRIQFTLEFPDYTRDELGMIANFFLEKQGYTIDDDALERVLDITEYYRGLPNFANARTVRNVLNQVIMNQNLRTEDMGEDSVVIINDVEDYLIDEGIDLEKKKLKRSDSPNEQTCCKV